MLLSLSLSLTQNGMDSQHTVSLVPTQFTLYMYSRLSLNGETDEA